MDERFNFDGEERIEGVSDLYRQYAEKSELENKLDEMLSEACDDSNEETNEVADEIQRNIRHGITEINAHGHFSNSDTTMLYTVVNSFQYRNVVQIVLSVDPHAFINVQKTSEIYGNYYQKPLD